MKNVGYQYAMQKELFVYYFYVRIPSQDRNK